MRLVFAPDALRELEEAVEFVARDSRAAADRLSARIEGATGQLLTFPGLGVPLGTRGRRVLSVSRTPYRVVYAAADDAVTILHIWHGARRWPPAE